MWTAELPFADRVQAGRRLAGALDDFRHRSDVVVLALPRGGVPVGVEVARALDAPFDVCVVRKLGLPGQEELAMGAIASGDVRVVNRGLIEEAKIDDAVLDQVAAREGAELMRRERAYRGGHAAREVSGRVALLVDDGLATGATMRAAVLSERAQHAAEVVVAVPVAPAETCEELERDADRVVCLATPTPFQGVGAWYDDFAPPTDDEVRRLLDRRAGAA